MEYQWYEEDSDMGEEQEEEEESAAEVKQETHSVGSRQSTITLSSGGMETERGDNDEDLLTEEESEDDAFEAALIYEKEAAEHQFLKDDVKMAARNFPKLEQDLCIPSAQIEGPVSGNEGTCSVALTLNVTHLPEMIRHLWELGSAMTVAVIVDGIHKEEFRKYYHRPTVLARLDSDKPSKFPVGECLSNIVRPMITNMYTLVENKSPSEIGSFFSMIYENLVERLRTLTDYCMVCGDELYAGGLLPSICGGTLCQYQYQELGLLDGLSTPRVSADVLSLLMMAFNAAANNPRWVDILTPAPSARDQERLIRETKQLYKKLDGRKFNQVVSLDVHHTLSAVMPCAKEILKTPSHYKEFKQAYPSIAEFVEWLVISNQSYLELVPPKLNVAYLQTPNQFLFVADTPAKQAEFDALVKKHGGKTRYLFHGSRHENWHSIIRSGLKNMSGTKYQLVGAAYGAGIYLSNHLATSHHYCTKYDHRCISDNCALNKCCMPDLADCGLALLAVVEVVDTPEVYVYNQDNIIVVKEEKWCSIRMLVAYSGVAPPQIDLNRIDAAARKQIQDVAHMFKTADLMERAKHV